MMDDSSFCDFILLCITQKSVGGYQKRPEWKESHEQEQTRTAPCSWAGAVSLDGIQRPQLLPETQKGIGKAVSTSLYFHYIFVLPLYLKSFLCDVLFFEEFCLKTLVHLDPVTGVVTICHNAKDGTCM